MRDRVRLAGVIGAVIFGLLASNANAVSSQTRPRTHRRAPATLWSAPESIPAALDRDVPPTPVAGFGLATSAGAPEPGPALALDGRGDAVTVWTETRINWVTVEDELLVRAAVRPNGGRWQSPETITRIEPPAADQSSPGGWEPTVTIDADGEAIAVWDTPSGVHAAIRPAGGRWLVQPSFPQAAVPGAEEPQVASDAAGDAIAVWPREVAENSAALGHSRGIEAALRPGGGAFAEPQVISGDENAWHPRVALDARGDAIVTWEDYRARGCAVMAAFRPALGAWSAPTRLSGVDDSCGGDDRVAVGEGGRAIVAWQAGGRSMAYIEAATHTDSGKWSPRRVLAKAPFIPALFPPQVAVDTRGDAGVVWPEPILDIGGEALWGTFQRPGQRWQRPRRIPGSREGPAAIAIDSRGDALVLWETNHEIEVDVRTRVGHWAAPRVLARPGHPVNGPAVLSRTLTLVADPQGQAMLAWRERNRIRTVWSPSAFP